MNYDLKPLTLGGMIGKAFNIYFDNFAPLVLITLVTKIPLILYIAFITSSAGINWITEDLNFSASSYGLFITIGAYFFTFLFSFIESGLSIKVISKRYLNKPVIIPQLIKETIPVILPLIGLSFLIGLITMGGYLLLFIPGIIFYMASSLSSQVLIVEGKGVIASLKRSWALTKKRRSRILGYSFVMSLIIGIPSYILQSIFQFVASDFLDANLFLLNVFPYLLTIFTTPISAAFIVLIYFNIRIEKEGFAVEHLTNEFSLADADNSADPYL